jgi:hypothetical protein
MDRGRWHFRAVESADGWLCRHGSTTYDAHPTLEESLRHLTRIATRPALLIVHHLDGRIVTHATLD